MIPEKELHKKLTSQDFDNTPSSDPLQKWVRIADAYIETENVIAVLSDLRANKSYIRHGEIANVLDLDISTLGSETWSIWETEIFKLIHPDDLQRKHIEELKFFHFISTLPKNKRTRFFLASPLRMRTKTGQYISILHRIFYFYDGNAVRLSLCLYGANWGLESSKILNSVTGEAMPIENSDCGRLLSNREQSVLGLVAKGTMSKDIADMLHISIHTVHRHRQNILEKLQAANSAEAVRTARELKII